MSTAYVIEVAGRTAGIVAPDVRGYRFHAALQRFNPIDGHHFRNPADAERAARRLAARTPASNHSFHGDQR